MTNVKVERKDVLSEEGLAELVKLAKEGDGLAISFLSKFYPEVAYMIMKKYWKEKNDKCQS